MIIRVVSILAIVTGLEAITSLIARSDGINSLDTSITKHPWMISIRNGSGFHVCGGSLIRVDPNISRTDVALTAAHCFRGFFMGVRPLNNIIIAGATVNTFNNTTGQKRNVIAVQNYGFFPGDDALVLQFDSPLEFSSTIKPIDLAPEEKPVTKDAKCAVTGWGLHQHHPLQELPITIQACNNKRFDYGNTFCAAGDTGSICSGDSGSPLVCLNENDKQIQQGIVSYSDPSCGDHPASYARVSYYSKWIEETVQKMSALVERKE